MITGIGVRGIVKRTIYTPLSPACAISATTPLASAITPELPVLCTMRSTSRAGYDRCTASPTFATRYIPNSKIYTGLRPSVSASSPKNVGAIPWKIM